MNNVWQKVVGTLSQSRSYETMFHLMERFPDNIAAELTDKDGKLVTRTYKEYIEMSYNCAGALQNDPAFEKGRIIGLSYDTCMDWPVLFWGVLMAGGIPLLINPGAGAGLHISVLKEACANAYIAAAPVEGCSLPFVDAGALLASKTRGREDWSEYVALHTSGTTGASRVFLYRGSTIAAHILSYQEAKRLNNEMPFDEELPCKLLAFLPFHHVFGFSVIYILYSITGKTIVYLRDRGVQTILSACRDHRVTHLYCVPLFFNALAAGLKKKVPAEQLEMLCKQSLMLQAAGKPLPEPVIAMQKQLLGTDIRLMITGGGHVPAETLQILNAVGYPLHNGFGMTECGVIAVELSLDPFQRIKGSIGFPFSLTEYRIGEDGGDSGEMYLRGGSLFDASIVDGEWVCNDKTKWFATGDIICNVGGSLFIEGRSKDVIVNASGENIYPDDLEDSFAELPGVVNLCILGLPGKVYDSVALVLVAPDADKEALRQAIIACNDRLDPYCHVTEVLLCSDMLPISGSGKVMRKRLREELVSGARTFTKLLLGSASAGQKTADPQAAAEELAEIKETIRAILAENFDVDSVGDGDHFINDLGGDSLSLMSAMTDVEEKFGFIFTDSEIKNLFTLNDTARLVYAKLHNESYDVGKREKAFRRITDFAESEEYTALKKRMEETFKDIDNPYFLPHDSLIRDTSVIGGKRVINLGSYNYLGMSGHPETMRAAIEAVEKYGTSASGSRTLAGEKTLYQELERTIAAWKHTEDAIVCTGGWATNLAFISCFMREGDFILYDALSHNSITEGVALSGAESKAFAHNNIDMAESILKQIEGRYNKVLIVTEGVYSMDGDIAPIPRLVELKKKYKCFLMVDEAHSTGVIGEHGGGVDEYFELLPTDVDIKYGTMSKTLGTCGGYIAARHEIIEYLRYSMNGFVFTAGIAPPLAAACKRAIELIQSDDSMVRDLHRNIEYFVRRCREEGMNTGLAGQSAIVPVLIGSDADAARLSAKLMERGVFVPPAMYPAVPMGESRLRFTVSSTHSIEQLETAVTELSRLMHEEHLL